METEKNKWISEITSSGKHLQDLHAPDHLYENIVNAISSGSNYTVLSFTQFKQLLVAASVLVIINLGILMYINSRNEDRVPTAYALDSYNLSLY